MLNPHVAMVIRPVLPRLMFFNWSLLVVAVLFFNWSLLVVTVLCCEAKS